MSEGKEDTINMKCHLLSVNELKCYDKLNKIPSVCTNLRRGPEVSSKYVTIVRELYISDISLSKTNGAPFCEEILENVRQRKICLGKKS